MSKTRDRVILSGTASDSHTWNLVFLELLIREHGMDVVNLGPCVPAELLARRCRVERPAAVVLSSVNGHGFLDGLIAVERLRAEPELACVPVVIGGKLGLDGCAANGRAARLRAAGFAAVFGDDDLDGFQRFLTSKAFHPAGAGMPA